MASQFSAYSNQSTMSSINPPLETAPLVTNTEPAKTPGPEPIIGKHVRLERLEPKHFSDLWESIGQHTELWTWWPDGPFEESEFHKEMSKFMELLKGDLTVYSVFLLSGPHKERAAGLAMAVSEDRSTHRTSELGAFFGPWLQRTRGATEALFMLGDMMFRLNHRRLAWKTNSFNLASRRAAERYGFVQEGIIRQERVYKGRSRDSVFFGIIDSEWPICREAFEIWLGEDNFDLEGNQRRKLEDIREELKRK